MQQVGTVAAVMRYPVKSMRGESLAEARLTFQGIAFDRQIAFVQATSKRAFPWLSARELPNLLRYQSRVVGSGAGAVITVTAPDGTEFDATDDALRLSLQVTADREVYRLRDYRGSFDVAAISVIALETVQQIADESGTNPEPLRFRANLYVELAEPGGFGEDAWVGHTLAIGDTAQIAVQQQDERCVIITLDPASGESTPAVLRAVAQQHNNRAGIYAAVTREGSVRVGDAISIIE